MIFFGIDVSKNRSTVAAIGEEKKIIQKPYDITHSKTDLAELAQTVKKHGDVRVVMEYTGVYYQVVAETLVKSGIHVSVVNPVLVSQYGNNSLRKVKTDSKDALKIARYAFDNRDELREYSLSETLRDNLKSFVRQFNFEDKTLSMHKNQLYALLERTFPRIDGIFTSDAKPNGHQKLVDFVIQFWHNDCVADLSLSKFTEKYRNFCRKNRYIFDSEKAAEIHALSRNNLTTMLKTDATELLISSAAEHVMLISVRVEKLRTEMIKLAKQLPEWETVLSIYGVGETIAAKLIGEIGDVRRFESKRSLVAYAGVDPDKNDSGKKVSISGKISRSGDSLIRKTAFQAVEIYLLNSPADEPIYQFLDKKRAEGKNYYVYMTAACNKFLRVYFARVKECMDALETDSPTEISAKITMTEPSLNTVKNTPECIVTSKIVNNTIAHEQDRATQECDPSGYVSSQYR
jgi:transposase